MVAAAAIHRPACRITGEAVFERGSLDPLHLKCRRAGEGVREISMSVLESSRALPDRVDDISACEHRADRLVAAAESLGDGLDVGRDALLFPRVKRSGAAHAAHHLVQMSRAPCRL